MLLLLRLLLALILQIETPMQPEHGFEPIECPFGNASGYLIECGYVTVPADHAHLERGTMRIAVAIIRSPAPRPDPVLFLAGGPGDNGVMRAPLTAIRYAELLKARDLIIFDQRGAGMSQPTLNCPQITSALFADSTAFAEAAESVFACSHQLSEEIDDVTLFNTQQSADDVAFLISALGYSRANLLGVSYGTRLGLTVLAEHPEQIRSAVLDSVTPLQINVYEQIPIGFERALGEVETMCQADFECRLAYPNLQNRYYRLYANLEAAPVIFEDTNRQTQHQITGQVLSQFVLMSLYGRESISRLPAALSEIEAGNYAPLAEWIEAMPVIVGGQGVGMTLAVMCADQGSRTSPERVNVIEAQYDPALSPNYGLFGSGGAALCAAWGVDFSTPGQDIPAVSTVPTLLLGGQFDPVTPPRWAALASETLRDSQVIELANIGHAVTFSQCGIQLAAAYFDDPTRSLDGLCALPAVVFDLSEWVTRPVVAGMTGLFGAISLWGSGLALIAFARQPRYFGYSTLIKQTYCYWALGSLLVILGLFSVGEISNLWFEFDAQRVVGLVVPVAIGLQAALLLSPSDEPALEVLAACPRGLGWLVAERWGGVLVTQGLVAVGLMLVSAFIVPGQDLAVMIARWLPPSIFFSGLAFFITLRSRVAAFGLVMIGVLWFIFVGFGDVFLPGALPLFPPLNYIQPFLWGIHPYLQPDDLSSTSYWLNRMCITVFGLSLMVIAVYGLRNEEQVLFDGKKR